MSNKLQPCSLQCVFVGCSDKHRGYRCLHPPTGRLYISRHVIFHEDQIYYAAAPLSISSPPLAIVPVDFLPNQPTQPQVP